VRVETTVKQFKELLEKMKMLEGALGTVYFDALTGAPRGGADSRAKRMGFLQAEIFSLLVSDEMKNCLDTLAAHEDSLDEITRAMLRETRRNYEKEANIPVETVRAYSELTSKAHIVWEDAKASNDFASFAPYLERIIAMKKEMLAYRGSDELPYNQLLDDYEPGQTMETLDVFFAKLKAAIVPFFKELKESGKQIDTNFKHHPVAIEAQREISDMLAEKVGYDLNRGMIRETEHPFCITIGGRDDVRITTHYHEMNFLSSFYSVIHECGHAIYEQNKKDEIAGTILDDGVSMGIHESQSRLYENVIGRSRAFWGYICDELKTKLPDQFAPVTADMLYTATNQVEASLIRIEADELTYPLHIMVRYELEKLLFSGDVDVYDLPRLWNEKMEEYLGITPPDDARGILQDVHWSEGLMGYFPSYAIGSAYAAQFWAYMEREMDVYGLIQKGEFAPITDWLKNHIHAHGLLYTPTELVHRIAGEQLNVEYYIAYLTQKFRGIYGI